jgi:ABC-type proline/glycine betaine transport system permease subunit
MIDITGGDLRVGGRSVRERGAHNLGLPATHLELTAASLALALVIALPLGLLLVPRRRSRRWPACSRSATLTSFAVYGREGQIGASILVALLAIAAELGLSAVQRAVTPSGIKLERGAEDRARARFGLTKRRIQTAP